MTCDSPKFTYIFRKLMLAKIQYTFFLKDWGKMFGNFLPAIHREITAFTDRHNLKTDNDNLRPMNTQYRKFAGKRNEYDDGEGKQLAEEEENEKADDQEDQTDGKDFWDRHFSGQREVSWIDFRSNFISDYSERISDEMGEDKNKWLVNLMYKDLFNLNKSLNIQAYLSFIGSESSRHEGDLFYERIREYAIGSFAMREVFNMESSVRLTAVRNLGELNTR